MDQGPRVKVGSPVTGPCGGESSAAAVGGPPRQAALRPSWMSRLPAEGLSQAWQSWPVESSGPLWHPTLVKRGINLKCAQKHVDSNCLRFGGLPADLLTPEVFQVCRPLLLEPGFGFYCT